MHGTCYFCSKVVNNHTLYIQHHDCGCCFHIKCYWAYFRKPAHDTAVCVQCGAPVTTMWMDTGDDCGVIKAKDVQMSLALLAPFKKYKS
jgi:hypothetical protein